MKRSYLKYSSLALQILKVAGIAAGTVGLIAAAITLPNLVGALAKTGGRSWRRRPSDKKQVQRALAYLEERGFVTIESYDGDVLRMRLTRKGVTTFKKIEVYKLQLPRGVRWDGIWRLIIFDVPNKQSKQRRSFAQHLKNLGCHMAQRSVWIYPYACYDEIMMLRKFYDIERFVTYCETKYVEDDNLWKSYFDLPSRSTNLS